MLVAILFLQVSSFGQSQLSHHTDTIITAVDGHNIYLFVSGAGKHTVVFESGLGASHRCWQAVDTSIARSARVVTYDRPGYLNSDTCGKPRDAATISTELRLALQKANIPPPYVMVGWSLGGSLARVFAGQFPGDVSGLVLIDPAPEESYARFEKESPESLYEDSLYFAEVFSSNRHGEKKELFYFESSMKQARSSDDKYDVPVILLISRYGKAPGVFSNDPKHIINQIWTEELIKWADKKRGVKYQIVENSGHHIAKEKPLIVTNAILGLLKELE